MLQSVRRARQSVGTAGQQNRALTVSADSLDFLRASTVQLDGDRAARMHSILFTALQDGTYVARARVERADGRVMVSTLLLEVRRGR